MAGPSQTFWDLTARPITPKMQTWIYELTERFGDDRVSAAMRSLAPTGDIDKLLERVRKTLATEDARRAIDAPTEVDGPTLMAIVRGETKAPDGAWTYDSRGLTKDEYTDVLGWATKRVEARS